MRIIGVDPGQFKSGYIVYDVELGKVEYSSSVDNEDVLHVLRGLDYSLSPTRDDVVAIENIESQGRVVGKSTFDTCAWRGRFQEAWERWSGKDAIIVSRGDEKIVLCGTATYLDPKTNRRRAIGDKQIRQSLIDRFQQTGGGKTPQIGTKSNPGPLYGVSGHCWQALAVAITALLTMFPTECGLIKV